MSNPTLPGMPKSNPEATAIRDRIRVAVIELHHAMLPLLEVLGSSDSIAMVFTVSGDKLKVSLTPGKANDETRRNT